MSQVVSIKASSHQRRAATEYNPKKGWSSAAQPESNLSAADYHTLAKAAAPNLYEQTVGFCERHGFSYIHIPHHDFQNGYERQDALSFREWFKEYCREKGYNKEYSANIDVCIIGPCIKTLESAKRKTDTNEPTPDRNVDYLRTMIVAMKKTGNYRNRHSLDTLAYAMNAIEGDQETIAIKNYYYTPHAKTGFRGHKSLWITEATEESGYAGMSILSEIKIEHESQMEIDKLTRRFIDIDRSWENASLGSFWKTVCGTRAASPKSLDNTTDVITGWGRLLYNRMFEDSGLTRFLNPELEHLYRAETWPHIIEQISSSGKEINATRYRDLRRAVYESGILTSKQIPRDVRQGAEALLCPNRR